jgi:hypothetical protein
VRRFAAWTGLLVLAGAAPACLLYTDPINSAPRVTMMPPASVHPHETLTFRAQASDPDGDRVTLDWYSLTGKCPDSCADSSTPAATGDAFEMTVEGHDPFCVRVVARDRYGATSEPQCYTGNPQNHPPEAVLSVDPPLVDSFPLYTTFRFTPGPATDDDGDPVTFVWKGLDPQGASLGLTPCDPLHPEVRCLSAGAPGRYTITVEGRDGLSTGTPASLVLPVLEDAPPCIEATDPLQDTRVVVLAVTDHRNFEVRRVRDDGNPFPPGPQGGATFQWSTFKEGSVSWVRYLGFDRSIFEVSAALFEDARPGSSYQVRVEVRDPQHQSGDDLLGCNETPVCKVPDKCVRWVTWSVLFQ